MILPAAQQKTWLALATRYFKCSRRGLNSHLALYVKGYLSKMWGNMKPSTTWGPSVEMSKMWCVVRVEGGTLHSSQQCEESIKKNHGIICEFFPNSGLTTGWENQALTTPIMCVLILLKLENWKNQIKLWHQRRNNWEEEMKRERWKIITRQRRM